MDIKNTRPVTLKDVKIGSSCIVLKINAEGSIRRRFLDLGIVPGTSITALNRSPSGDPVAYLIRCAVIAIRSEDAEKILVKTLS